MNEFIYLNFGIDYALNYVLPVDVALNQILRIIIYSSSADK